MFRKNWKKWCIAWCMVWPPLILHNTSDQSLLLNSLTANNKETRQNMAVVWETQLPKNSQMLESKSKINGLAKFFTNKDVGCLAWSNLPNLKISIVFNVSQNFHSFFKAVRVFISFYWSKIIQSWGQVKAIVSCITCLWWPAPIYGHRQIAWELHQRASRRRASLQQLEVSL